MIIGTFLTLALFHFDFNKFKNAELYKKIFYWIPIFIVFTFIAFSNNFIKLLCLILISTMIIFEYLRVISETHKKSFFIIYLAFFLAAVLHFILLSLLKINLTDLLLVIGISSALSDVTAFFFGKYMGGHKLPFVINANKSWEGILGQIVGALLGVISMKLFILTDVNLLLFIPIGIGSTLGDILNSFIKRRAKIDSWSNFIPGHGGFMDRFSSFTGSAMFTYYFLLLLKY